MNLSILSGVTPLPWLIASDIGRKLSQPASSCSDLTCERLVMMIHGSASEFSTIFTMMKVSQEVTRRLQHDDSAITFDLAIYKKAKADSAENFRRIKEHRDTHKRIPHRSELPVPSRKVCKFRIGRPADRILCLCCWYHISSYAWEVIHPWYWSSQAQYGSTLSSSLASISAMAGKPNSGSDYPRQAEFESQDPGMSTLLQGERINLKELRVSGN